ncbi:MAG: Type 1 glutamine amidotransferase-like domain-containing protein [Actinomycetota bacterium]|nr:Type 1 glutamine amidotransferase-like domain-containing protein [Actinomycetota bacterium]
MTTEDVTGILALIGGAEWRPGCDFDAELLERSGGREVLVLPTAAAYERPERAVATARAWFERFGAEVRGLMVLSHADARAEANADAVRNASFVYLGGGSPLHLLSVLKGSELFEAIEQAWRAGAVVAGSSAGAMVLGDPMVDPRGGAFTVGLGLVEQLAVLAHYDPENTNNWRTLELAPPGVVVAGIPERTALVRDPGGKWRTAGEGEVALRLDGETVTLERLSS